MAEHTGRRGRRLKGADRGVDAARDFGPPAAAQGDVAVRVKGEVALRGLAIGDWRLSIQVGRWITALVLQY